MFSGLVSTGLSRALLLSIRSKRKVKGEAAGASWLVVRGSAVGNRSADYRPPATGLRHRKADSERGPLAHYALGFQAGVMALGDPFRDCQAQAGAPRIAIPGLVGAIETLEDVRQRRIRNSDSCVAHRNRSTRWIGAYRYRYPSARWRVLHRIIEQ